MTRPAPRKSSLAGATPVAPQATPEPPAAEPAATQQARTTAEVNRTGATKLRMPFQATAESCARIRATEHTARLMEGYASMSEWMEAVMIRECQRLEEKYNNGDRFPLGTPRRGRPVLND